MEFKKEFGAYTAIARFILISMISQRCHVRLALDVPCTNAEKSSVFSFTMAIKIEIRISEKNKWCVMHSTRILHSMDVPHMSFQTCVTCKCLVTFRTFDCFFRMGTIPVTGQIFFLKKCFFTCTALM